MMCQSSYQIMKKIDTSAENDNNQIVTDNISDGVTTVENNDKDNYKIEE